MLTPDQKIRVAVIGGAIAIQGVAVAAIAATGFRAANTADGLFGILKDNAEKLSETDIDKVDELMKPYIK